MKKSNTSLTTRGLLAAGILIASMAVGTVYVTSSVAERANEQHSDYMLSKVSLCAMTVEAISPDFSSPKEASQGPAEFLAKLERCGRAAEKMYALSDLTLVDVHSLKTRWFLFLPFHEGTTTKMPVTSAEVSAGIDTSSLVVAAQVDATISHECLMRRKEAERAGYKQVSPSRYEKPFIRVQPATPSAPSAL